MILAHTSKAKLLFYKWINRALNDKFIQAEIDKLSVGLSLRERSIIDRIVRNVPPIDSNFDKSVYYKMLFWFYVMDKNIAKGNIFLALKQFDPKGELFTPTWVKNSESIIHLLNRYLQFLEIQPQHVGLQHLNVAFGLADLLSNES